MQSERNKGNYVSITQELLEGENHLLIVMEKKGRDEKNSKEPTFNILHEECLLSRMQINALLLC